MKIKIAFLLLLILFITGCAASRQGIDEQSEEINRSNLFTVKIINDSMDKVLLRYQGSDLSYTFRFVDPEMDIKFQMNGELSLQYSIQGFDDAKLLSIQQHTLIHVKNDDILIDFLPEEEVISYN